MILNELRQQVSNVINDANLPIDAIYFVMKDIFNEIEKLYYLQLQKEEAKNKEEEEEKPEE